MGLNKSFWLHRIDSKDVEYVTLPKVSYRFVVYATCEDDYGVVYVLDDHQEAWEENRRRAA